MAKGHHNLNCIKGCNTRKVENQCSRHPLRDDVILESDSEGLITLIEMEKPILQVVGPIPGLGSQTT